jgi:AraC-like DNA-binding protein
MSTVGPLYAFSLVSSLCVLFGLNFLFRKGNLVVAKVLAIQFLLLAYLVVAAYFLMPENIIQTPYFFRTLAPLFYALPPLNFLFMWHLFNPRVKFNPKHLLFFIPLLIQLIENTPFYLSSKATKIAEIQWMHKQGDFFAFSERFMWFDPIYHVYAKFAMYLIFYLAMVYYYARFRCAKQNQILFQKGIFHYWIIGVFLFRICTIYYIWHTFIYTDNGKDSFLPVDYLLIAEFVFHLFYLAVNPKLLDVQILAEQLKGPEPEPKTEQELVRAEKEDERLLALAGKVEEYFKTTEVFLNSQLSAELLGSLTGHPHRMIGQAIKLKHNISFRDFLNNYRIAYMEEQLANPDFLAKSSIEAIAEASGFGSRQSFYTAFRKAKGCTPKEYFSSKIG